VARERTRARDLIVYSCSWWNLPLGDAVNVIQRRWYQLAAARSGRR
jgi:hypothetical protein